MPLIKEGGRHRDHGPKIYLTLLHGLLTMDTIYPCLRSPEPSLPEWYWST
jgi:hypothetical protein